MIETGTLLITAMFSLFFLIAPFAVNAFYQRRAARHADEMLAENAAEFNRRVRTNAFILLIRRGLWGLFAMFCLSAYFRSMSEVEINWLTLIFFLTGIACFAFGAWGFKKELKRLKTLE
ncbi:MAG TPA: hypothetical protein VIL74_21850 [Pyrinomonadaceae bacterium]|jgi:hypothetical protein